jgi:SAM-dependent methyltransferase
LPVWKPAAKRVKWFVVATNIYQDALRRTGLRHDQISQPDFASLPDSVLSSYLDRINDTFRNYQTYAGLKGNDFRGARVLEVGPGETLGVALRFIGAGAREVVAVDKFVPLQTSSFHQRLYKQLMDQLPANEGQNIAAAVSLDKGVQFNPARVTYVYGQGMEEAAPLVAAQPFDLIVSNAVLEEVYEVDQMLETLDGLLKPGGRQVHMIDLRDYGMFSKYGFHPLEFLTIPDGLYRYMVEASGQPNRRLLDYYRSKMTSLGYQTTFFRAWVVGGTRPLVPYPTELKHGRDYSDANLQLVRSIRGRLLPRYRSLSDDDLLTASVLMVAEKPARATQAALTR